MVYKKIADMDEDRPKTYELEQACKNMLFTLTCMSKFSYAHLVSHQNTGECTIDQVVTHQPFAMQASVQFQANSCVVCHEQKKHWDRFFPLAPGFMCQYHSINAPHWFI